MKEKISYYWWRLTRLICFFKHDFKIAYTRTHVGGDKDGHYSGRMDCKRCFESEYFSGVHK